MNRLLISLFLAFLFSGCEWDPADYPSPVEFIDVEAFDILPSEVEGNEVTEKNVLFLINKERLEKGSQLVFPNYKLKRVAKDKAALLIKTGKWEHSRVNGKKKFAEDAKRYGYKFKLIGENLSKVLAGESAWDVFGQHQAWMYSKAHKDIMLDDRYSDIGIAIAKSKEGIVYTVTIFGEPA